MGISRKKALERGQQLIERPRGALELNLFHGKRGLTVRHQGKVIARTHSSRIGRILAPFVAEALGVELPKIGSAVEAVASSGVIYRVLSISSLDLRQAEARELLTYLLEEAAAMRHFGAQQIL